MKTNLESISLVTLETIRGGQSARPNTLPPAPIGEEEPMDAQRKRLGQGCAAFKNFAETFSNKGPSSVANAVGEFCFSELTRLGAELP